MPGMRKSTSSRSNCRSLSPLDGSLPVGRSLDGVAVALEQRGGRHAEGRIVVDDENSCAAHTAAV